MTQYVKDLFERVLMTFAQTLAGLALADQPFNLLSFDWNTALAVSASASLLALLKGVLARSTGPTDGAGLGT